MKKLLSAFLVVALIFSLAACKKDTDKTTTSIESTTLAGDTESTTAEGVTEYVTDENGEVVTDESGNPVTVPAGETETLISEETMPAGKPIEVTTTPSGKPANSLIDSALGNIFKGSKYSIKFTSQINLDGVKQTMPAAIYVSGKKSFVELTMNPGLGKMGILNNDAGNYFLVSALAGLLKGYVKVPADQAGDYDEMFNFSGISGTDDMQYIQTTKVTYKRMDYICEEYKSDGTTVKFFFNDGKLKRIEQVGDDGSKVFMENIQITASFSESIFNIPKGYKELKEKDLEKLSGLFG